MPGTAQLNVPFGLSLRAGDKLKMEIFLNRAASQVEFTATKAPGTPEALRATATVPIARDQLENVYFRHAGFDSAPTGKVILYPRFPWGDKHQNFGMWLTGTEQSAS